MNPAFFELLFLGRRKVINEKYTHARVYVCVCVCLYAKCCEGITTFGFCSDGPELAQGYMGTGRVSPEQCPLR